MSTLGGDLRAIIGDESRVIAENIPHAYQSDKLGRKTGHAEAVVIAKSTEEVSEVLRYAYDRRIPVTPSGAGTNLVGATVPDKGGIIIDVSQMNRILELDRETLTVTVEPGIRLMDLAAFVESEGLFYPPDPGDREASIGGNISTNAGGMRAVKYGVTRDYVRALEIVQADGTVLTVGSKNVKDTTGLNLKQLFIGSEGTLGIITRATLRLVALPESQVSVLCAFPDLETGIRAVPEILGANVNPVALEFMERNVVKLGEDFLNIRYPRQDAGSYLLLSFDGHKEEVENAIGKLEDLLKTCGVLEVLPLEKKQSEDIWKVRGALVKSVEAVSEQEPLDIVVPISETARFVKFVNELSEKCGMQMISFGHAGDGNVHLCVVRGNRSAEAWNTELDRNLTELYDGVYRMHGLISGEHGLGLSKRKYFFAHTPEANVRMMNAVKDALDPRHILNDGKSYIR